jgi:ParB/RepB/Spo0J family partition protein
MMEVGNAAEVNRTDTSSRIPLDKIDDNPFSTRLGLLQIDDLINSFATLGQLSPIKLRISPKDPKRYEIVFGHRRVAAARKLGWSEITADVVRVSDSEMIIFTLSENLDRSNFSDYEIGLLIRKLKEQFHLTMDDIARQIGRSRSYVSEYLQLTYLFDDVDIDHSEVQRVLSQLTVRQSRILYREHDVTMRFQMAKLAISEGLGLKELERLIGHPRGVTQACNDFETPEKDSNPQWSDQEQIANLVMNVIQGVNQRDVTPFVINREPKLFSLFDDFPPLDLFDFDGATEHNIDVIRSMDQFKIDYDKLRIYIYGKFAYSTFFVTYRMLYDGKWSVGRSRVTFVFAKKNNKWFIIHEHWSPTQSEFIEQAWRIIASRKKFVDSLG